MLTTTIILLSALALIAILDDLMDTPKRIKVLQAKRQVAADELAAVEAEIGRELGS